MLPDPPFSLEGCIVDVEKNVKMCNSHKDLAWIVASVQL